MYLTGTPCKDLASVVIEAKNQIVPKIINEKIEICNLFFLVLKETKFTKDKTRRDTIPSQSFPKKLFMLSKLDVRSTTLGN